LSVPQGHTAGMPNMEGYYEILDRHSPVLFEHRVPASLRAGYRKWVRFYLDSCRKPTIRRTMVASGIPTNLIP
jgi:hypothetical protein